MGSQTVIHDWVTFTFTSSHKTLKKYIYLFMTVLGPHHCVVFSLVCGEQGPLPSCGACNVLCPYGAWTLGYASFSSCGMWAWQLCLQGFRAQPNCSGLVVQWHMGSSRIWQDWLLWQADSSPLRHQESPHTEHLYVITACRVWDIMNCISIKCI